MNKYFFTTIIVLPFFIACAGPKAVIKTVANNKEANLKIINTVPFAGFIPQEMKTLMLPVSNACNSKFINFNTAAEGGPIITRLDDDLVNTQINSQFGYDTKVNTIENINSKMLAVLNPKKLGSEFARNYADEIDFNALLNKTISDAKLSKSLVYIFSKATVKLAYDGLPIFNNEFVLKAAIAKDICNNDITKNVIIIYGVSDKLLNTKPILAKVINKPLPPENKVASTTKVDNTNITNTAIKPNAKPVVKQSETVNPKLIVKPVIIKDSLAATKNTASTAGSTKTTVKTDPKAPIKIDPKKDPKKSDGGLEKDNIRKNVIIKSDTQ